MIKLTEVMLYSVATLEQQKALPQSPSLFLISKHQRGGEPRGHRQSWRAKGIVGGACAILQLQRTITKVYSTMKTKRPSMHRNSQEVQQGQNRKNCSCNIYPLNFPRQHSRDDMLVVSAWRATPLYWEHMQSETNNKQKIKCMDNPHMLLFRFIGRFRESKHAHRCPTMSTASRNFLPPGLRYCLRYKKKKTFTHYPAGTLKVQTLKKLTHKTSMQELHLVDNTQKYVQCKPWCTARLLYLSQFGTSAVSFFSRYYA